MKVGSQMALEQAVQAGRVIRRLANGMQLFFFPSRDYTREVSFTQGVEGHVVKSGGSEDDFHLAADGDLGFSWEPTSLVGGMDKMSLDMPGF